MYEYCIQNAQILDGSGGPPYSADLGISNGKIAALGRLSGAEALHTLDAGGRFLTPGFLDIHRHGDAALFRPDYGKAELAQGLTTVIGGNCGLSLAPVSGPHAGEILAYLTPITGDAPNGQRFETVDAYVRQAKQTPLRLHNAQLVGMGTLRACVAGFSDGPLDTEQLRALHTLLERALEDGAVGVSLGLGYAPECFYTTDQLLAALAPLRRSGVPITVHLRQEGDGVTAALEEMLTVARALETPVEISHLKAIGTRNWRKAVPDMLRRIGQARADGVDVGCDVYPYPAGSTQLLHVLPPEIQSGGTAALTAALRDPATRQAMRRRMETGRDFENITALVGFENVRATGLRLSEHRNFEGASLAEIAAAWGKDPFDALFDLLAAEACTVSMIDFIAAEDDIAEILRAPFSGVISDATYPTAGLLHPRVYGAFSRLLETYVRERSVLSLPEAVHKLTRLPADRFGFERKGRIALGADADLCLFSLEHIHETATWQAPAQLAQGMDYVFVGGVPAIAEGAFTDHFGGQCLTR